VKKVVWETLQCTCILEEVGKDDSNCDVFYIPHESPWQLNCTDFELTKSW
jgi:hypothetical protein